MPRRHHRLGGGLVTAWDCRATRTLEILGDLWSKSTFRSIGDMLSYYHRTIPHQVCLEFSRQSSWAR